MRKGIALFLILLMVPAVACGGRGAVSGPDANEPVGEETAAARITVSPPEGWEAFDSTGMLYSYQKGTATFLMKEESYFTVDTLDKVVREAQEIFNSTFANVEYAGEPEAITVGGLNASRFYFTCDLGGIVMAYEYVYLIIKGDVYAITFCDLGRTFDDNTADFDAILDSIVIR